jgi:hypothetical protein
LYFHLQKNSIRRMLTRNKHIRGVFRSMARLMAGLFAMQVLVGGFCLLTAEAHTMPQLMSMQTLAMDGNCAKAMHAEQSSHDQTSDHSDACYHCDQPAALSNASYASVVAVSLVLSDVISLPAAPLFSSEATGLFTARTPTGPPRSSSLLYTTSQRILI